MWSSATFQNSALAVNGTYVLKFVPFIYTANAWLDGNRVSDAPSSFSFSAIVSGKRRMSNGSCTAGPFTASADGNAHGPTVDAVLAAAFVVFGAYGTALAMLCHT